MAKKGLRSILVVGLLAVLVLTPAAGNAVSARSVSIFDQHSKNSDVNVNNSLMKSELIVFLEIEEAKNAGETWVNNMSMRLEEFGDWQNASLVAPLTFYDLNGEINSYLFGIKKNKEIIGHVLIGSSEYGYAIFNAGSALPLRIPDSTQIKVSLEDNGLKINQQADLDNPRLLHLGVDQFFAMYGKDSEGVAIDLNTYKAFRTVDLQNNMLSADEYKESQDKILQAMPTSTRAFYERVLSMHVVCSPPPGEDGWCGPCSASSIGEFYRDVYGYSSLPGDTAMFTDLMDGMGGPGPVVGSAYGPGFLAMTQGSGYYNFSYYNDFWLSESDYWSVVSDIDSNWPSGLLKYFTDFHWRAIRGYAYNTSGTYHVIVTDSATGENAALYNWSYFSGGVNDAKVSIHN